MSFAQFLTLLVAACLLLLGASASLFGVAMAMGEVVGVSASLFAAAVVLQRRGAADWLPVAGWMALGALAANLALPMLGVPPDFTAADPILVGAELVWRLIFLVLLLRGASGWGDGALLALCVATSRAGALSMAAGSAMRATAGDGWMLQGQALLGVLAALLAGLVVVVLIALLLAWVTGWGPLRRLRALAWLGLLAAAAEAWPLLCAAM